eukprot:scaffold77096_cov41-Prasinocladus_malaysianus.AAC.1
MQPFGSYETNPMADSLELANAIREVLDAELPLVATSTAGASLRPGVETENTDTSHAVKCTPRLTPLNIVLLLL